MRLVLRPTLKSTAIAVVAVLALSFAPANASALKERDTPADTVPVKIVTYNTMLLADIMSLGANYDNELRARRLAQLDLFKGTDVVVLQELFHISSSTQLLNGLYDVGFTYQTRVVGADKGPWETHARDWDAEYKEGGGLENGGVAILSRHPIERAEQLVYAKGCGADKHAQKGFAYARINKGGSVFHVVGTHPQATECGSREEAEEIREGQFTRIDTFLTGKERGNAITSSQPVLLAGDMNVDRYTDEYQRMLKALRATAPARSGETYSFDTRHNELAKFRYPSDGPEDLDYLLARTGHPAPADWSSAVTRPRTDAFEIREGFTYGTSTDLSDHYPLTSTGTLPRP
ncbi:sphingomyelin phosphodiesterase [Streptomyces syringium]|uniref:Sphingomyelin phosphodiesterase n=1 Tax=Streptomyces syringium TaxID=76729 RepID=A0ABS4XWQ5_9ACTN|nr:sphingomyelin phosphodiesterase [Streptomyces syringium]MBP2400815.1 sphingomyelin phosphodiesterase [Streptomyces syringium]